ncbi:hypothetical protein Tco_0461718 [Tanacetum coccineum]
MLTKQLELYKEKVRVFEITKEKTTKYFNEYIKADRKAKRFEQESQSQFIRDRDIIRDLEQQRDKLDLNVVELKSQSMELQKTQSILKRKMSENKDQYHDTVLNLKEKVKKNVDTINTEDILEDATKSQIKMKNKMKDPIAIKKKQNVSTINYNKLNALYEDFVPQKGLSAEQKYFPPSFISPEDPTNESSTYSSSETQPTKKQMPSANPILVDLNQMEK